MKRRVNRRAHEDVLAHTCSNTYTCLPTSYTVLAPAQLGLYAIVQKAAKGQRNAWAGKRCKANASEKSVHRR
jgi:hypothetical protein